MFLFFFYFIFIFILGGFPVQLAPSIVLPRRVLPSRIMNEHYSNLHFRNYNDIDNTPSTLAGRAIEEARNEESDNSVKYKNIKCSICLCNPTVGTRLDSTICGKFIFNFLIINF